MAAGEATPGVFGQEWGSVTQNFVSPSNEHALIPEKKEVRARTTRTPTNREASAQVRGYNDRLRVFGASSSGDLGGIATPKEIT